MAEIKLGLVASLLEKLRYSTGVSRGSLTPQGTKAPDPVLGWFSRNNYKNTTSATSRGATTGWFSNTLDPSKAEPVYSVPSFQEPYSPPSFQQPKYTKETNTLTESEKAIVKALGVDIARTQPMIDAGRPGLYRDEPNTSRRRVVVNTPGVSMAWAFVRLKEQPTIFRSRDPSGAPTCPGLPYSSLSWYTKVTQAEEVFSGSGTTQYTYEYGYDWTSVWAGPASPGQDMSGGQFGDSPNPYTGGVPSISSFGPVNPNFPDVNPLGYGDAKITSAMVFLPVDAETILYYSYYKNHYVAQLIQSQEWALCSASTPLITRFTNSYSLEDIQEVTSEKEVCLLISQNSIKQISVPEKFKQLIGDSVSQWSISPFDRIVGGVWEGVYREAFTIPGYVWVEKPPSQTLAQRLSGRFEKYSIATPPTGSKYITTAGVYRTLAAVPDFNYGGITSEAPSVTGVIDSAGFGSGSAWPQVYDAARTFTHASSGDTEPNILTMSSDKLPRPSDSLTYTSPEGFTLTANWSTTVALGYDWANPDFCREQLASLGFSSDKLVF